MLLLGLLAFPATASAYSGNASSPSVAQRSQLSAFVVGQAGPSSLEVRVSGSGFRSGVVFLSATEGGRTVSIQPMTVRTTRNGSFSQEVRIQLPFNVSRQQSFGQLSQLHPTQIALYATGRFGQSATSLLFLGQAYQGYQYGLLR